MVDHTPDLYAIILFEKHGLPWSNHVQMVCSGLTMVNHDETKFSRGHWSLVVFLLVTVHFLTGHWSLLYFYWSLLYFYWSLFLSFKIHKKSEKHSLERSTTLPIHSDNRFGRQHTLQSFVWKALLAGCLSKKTAFRASNSNAQNHIIFVSFSCWSFQTEILQRTFMQSFSID